MILAARYGSVADALPSGSAGDLVQIVPTSSGVSGSGSTTSITANGTVLWNSATYGAVNGCFKSDYRNYLVVIELFFSFNGATSMPMRMRKAGVDNTTNNGYYQWLLNDTGSLATMSFTSQTSFSPLHMKGDGTLTNPRQMYNLTMFDAYDADGTSGGTRVRTRESASFSSGANINVQVMDYASLANGGSNTWDGFSIGTTSSVWNARATIYGYKK